MEYRLGFYQVSLTSVSIQDFFTSLSQFFGIGAAVEIARGMASGLIWIFNSGHVISGSSWWVKLLNVDQRTDSKAILLFSDCLHEC